MSDEQALMVHVRVDGKYSLDGCETWINATPPATEPLCRRVLELEQQLADRDAEIERLKDERNHARVAARREAQDRKDGEG